MVRGENGARQPSHNGTTPETGEIRNPRNRQKTRLCPVREGWRAVKTLNANPLRPAKHQYQGKNRRRPFCEGWRAPFSRHANPHGISSASFFLAPLSCQCIRIRYPRRPPHYTFSVPAAPGRLLRPAPALKTVTFQKDFK